MGAADQIHVVFLEEAGDDIGTEGEADASVVFTPTGNIFVGVRPQKIAQKAAVRDLGRARVLMSIAIRHTGKRGKSAFFATKVPATEVWAQEAAEDLRRWDA